MIPVVVGSSPIVHPNSDLYDRSCLNRRPIPSHRPVSTSPIADCPGTRHVTGNQISTSNRYRQCFACQYCAVRTAYARTAHSSYCIFICRADSTPGNHPLLLRISFLFTVSHDAVPRAIPDSGRCDVCRHAELVSYLCFPRAAAVIITGYVRQDINARVAELVDALVLGTSVERRVSSSLTFRTNILDEGSENLNHFKPC